MACFRKKEKHRQEQLAQASIEPKDSCKALKQQSESIVNIEERMRRAERLSAISELTAIMAHEVRNPLSSIRGAKEILKDDFSPSDKKYEFWEIILKESDRLNHVVTNFLKLSKPHALEIVQFNIGDALHNIVMLVTAEARNKKFNIEVYAEDALEINGDKDKLH